MTSYAFRHVKLLATSILLACAAGRVHAEAVPHLSIRQALQLAEEALAPKNDSGQVYIAAIALQPTAFLTGKNVWSVQWSSPVTGAKAGSQEVGLEIGMDGAVIHLIKGRGASKPQPSPH